MLSAFPDYGKSPPEYLLTMTELVGSYPEHIQKKICDVKTGVASKENYLPSAKNITDMAEKLLSEEAKFASYAALRKSHVSINDRAATIDYNSQKKPYHCPFPKLEAAMAETMETKLLIGRNFDETFWASRILATEGKMAARDLLMKMAAKSSQS